MDRLAYLRLRHIESVTNTAIETVVMDSPNSPKKNQGERKKAALEKKRKEGW